MKVSKTLPAVAKILKATYPQWKGRKVSVERRAQYQLENYWDGGTRYYVKAMNLETGLVSDPSPATTTAFNAAAHAVVTIPPNVALVEHAIFCGKDCGVRIYINPACATVEALPAAAAETLEAVAS